MIDEKQIHIPPLGTLYFYLTGDCNMACRHCWISPTYEPYDVSQKALSFDLFQKIIYEAKEIGLSGVKLTGGEPFFHPDIIQILNFIKDQKLVLNIESNGVSITPSHAKLIKACLSPFISISIDGNRESHEWMRGVKGSYERVSQGVKNLVEAGIRPQVIMAVAKKNKLEMAELARYAQDLGASSIKYNFITPTARGEEMQNNDGIISVHEQIKISKWLQTDLQNELKIPIFTNLPLAFKSLSSLFGPQGNCGKCSIFTILGVLSDGTYALCGIGTNVPELCFGHASKDKLKEVWEKSDGLNKIRQHIPKDLKGICSKCLFKDICLGNCVANNYYNEKDLLAGHKFCEDAYAAGLFPKSRYKD